AVKLFTYMCATTNRMRELREDLEKERDHWGPPCPLVSEMRNTHSQELISKKVFGTPSEDLSHVWERALEIRFEAINRAITELDEKEEHAYKLQDNINHQIQKLGVPAMGEDTTTDELILPFEEYVKKE
ncbi:hypothetical protein KI387_031640, partial [Taxus chinensis]